MSGPSMAIWDCKDRFLLRHMKDATKCLPESDAGVLREWMAFAFIRGAKAQQSISNEKKKQKQKDQYFPDTMCCRSGGKQPSRLRLL